MELKTAESLFSAGKALTWSNFPVISLDLEFEMRQAFRFPAFAGSMFRGVLGWALKELCCERDYHRLFETSSDSPGQADATRPFVLVPPLQQRDLRERDRFRVTLQLFGPACAYVSTFVEAFTLAGRMGLGAEQARFDLLKVVACEGPSSWVSFERSQGWERAYLPLPTSLGSFAWERPDRTVTELSLDFITPTRLVHQGHPVRQPDFHVILRALYRRLDALLQQQGLPGLNVDFRADIQHAQSIKIRSSDCQWADWERTSQRQGGRHIMGGLVGSVIYEGDFLDHWLPLLSLSSLVHIGKATTFGMGLVQL